MTAPVPTSGLSAERVEETTPMQELRSALDATITLVSNLHPRLSTRQATELRESWSRIYAAIGRTESALASAREETAQAVREFKTLKLAVCLDEKAVNDRIRDRYFELLDDPARVDGEYGRYEVLREYGFVRSRSLPGETADA